MKLYNTLTRSLEPLAPLDPQGRAVTMYVCGPTVYDVPHIGHARSAYIFDVLRRYLQSRGYQVRFVRNVTDVDDKIIDRAKQEHPGQDLNAACRAVAEKYLASYHDAMDRLGLARPTEEPRATAHVVPAVTDFISKLLIHGAAYEAKGDVYFAVRKCEGYGALSNRTLDELQAGARVEPGEQKQDPLDFALWKAAKPGEPSWPSPWGPGRPGWHIECTVMSTQYLGDAFDIHGGGVDLVFPHHENEVAQARGVGKPFARTWIHNGLLTVKGEKMSKSLGNFLTLEQVVAEYPHPDYLKLFFLKTHYRSPIDYAPVKMEEARKNWQEFSRFFQHYDQQKLQAGRGGSKPETGTQAARAFQEAMDDDLNTPKALAVLFELVNLGHRALEAGDATERACAMGVAEALIHCGATLGLFLQGMTEEHSDVVEHIAAMIGERDRMRKAKQFSQADAIRTQLRQEGVLLTDTSHGTLWRRIDPS